MTTVVNKPNLFILDVDGVLSTGQFLYDSNGKQYKIFGAHDNEGLKIISKHIKVNFISADSRGFEISKTRVEDMGFEINFVSEDERIDFFQGWPRIRIVSTTYDLSACDDCYLRDVRGACGLGC